MAIDLRFNCWLYDLPESRIAEVVGPGSPARASQRPGQNLLERDETALADPNDPHRLSDVTLSMDDPEDQAKLAGAISTWSLPDLPVTDRGAIG